MVAKLQFSAFSLSQLRRVSFFSRYLVVKVKGARSNQSICCIFGLKDGSRSWAWLICVELWISFFQDVSLPVTEIIINTPVKIPWPFPSLSQPWSLSWWSVLSLVNLEKWLLFKKRTPCWETLFSNIIDCRKFRCMRSVRMQHPALPGGSELFGSL